jgi:hypothetical protein
VKSQKSLIKIMKLNFLIKLINLIVIFSMIAGCSGNKSLENLLSTTPITPKPETTPTTEIKPATPTPKPETPETPEIPEDFPRYFLGYPEATLTKVIRENQTIKTWWESADQPDQIKSFYQEKLTNNQWEIINSLGQESNSNEPILIARKDDSEVKLTMLSSAGKSEFLIEYLSQPTETTPETNINQPTNNNPTTFQDLDQVPEVLRSYVEDLAKLGVLGADSATSDQFNPNQGITRREYARWLLTTHNKLYSDRPSQQTRLAAASNSPIFQDLPNTDPDFAIIQGLAEAGIIPSPLSGDPTAVSFRPNNLLTREELLMWKVPLDQRQALPVASLDAVKETWGFQDVAKINPQALRSLLVDFQNGELSNIRRAFGYTTLFQPQKTVTRAEAAASLWYFGSQGQGVSASPN